MGEELDGFVVVGLQLRVARELVARFLQGLGEPDGVGEATGGVRVDAVVLDVLADVVEPFLGAKVEFFSEVSQCLDASGEGMGSGGDGAEEGSRSRAGGMGDSVGHGDLLARDGGKGAMTRGARAVVVGWLWGGCVVYDSVQMPGGDLVFTCRCVGV